MPELKVPPMVLFPQFVIPDALESALPLEHTSVAVQVTGPVAAVVVTQRFGNPLKEPAELDYLFPLPEDAAITGFELTVGARKIAGDLQEIESARQSYEAAREQGKRAGLFEQRRPNLFAVRIANIQPSETIQATMRYQQRLKFNDDSYEFVFPMGITPKYDSPNQPGEGQGTHAPIAFAGEKIGPVEIQLSADAGVALAGEISSPSHPVEVTRLDERRFQASLGGEQLPDHDFVLRWVVSGDALKTAAWTSGESGKEIFLATLLPPRLEDDTPAEPREFVFVLDRSGSMSGEPIRQARNALQACLRTLNPEDTFRLLLFDNVLEWYRGEPVKLNQSELEQADAFISQVEGRGGTEIVAAVEAALELPSQPGRSRFIVFLTDGAVSAEERALEQIRGKIGASRLFTFGIGPSVNRALLNRMASLGRGRSEFLQLDEDIEGAIIRFQDSVSFPMLTDVKVEWEGAKVWDVYPSRVPDLYAGQTIELCGRLARADGQAALKVTGRRAGKDVALQVALPQPQGKEAAIERLWARSRVDDLTEQQAVEPSKAAKLRDEIIGIALEYQLVTQFTAFVAVDTQPGETRAKPRVIHVAQPLPQGLQMGAFQPPQSVMAAMMPSAPMPLSKAGGGAAAPAGGGLLRAVSQLIGAKQAGRAADSAGAPAPEAAEARPLPGPEDREGILRWLARTQNADGSWNGDAERTAAALLAFLRNGQNTRSGSYRQVIRKALRYLAAAPLAGFTRFLHYAVLHAQAQSTGDSKDLLAAQAALATLPAPASSLEEAALGKQPAAPQAIRSLDDLRLAALLKAPLKPDPALLSVKDAELARTWAAALP